MGQLSVEQTGAGRRPVDENQGRLALFDLDRTLITGSSLTTLAAVAARHRLVGPTALLHAAHRNVVFSAAGERGDIADVARRTVLQAIDGRPVAEFEEIAHHTVRRLLRRVRPDMRRAVDLHLGLGDVCVILSASPHEIVDGLATALGMHAGIGTQGQIVDGRYTGRIDGEFCHGRGKLDRLRAVFGHLEIDTAVCYADSASDLPVLEAVGVPIVVSPDRELRRIARERAWSHHR